MQCGLREGTYSDQNSNKGRTMKPMKPLWLSRANYMHSDAASQGGGWWQGCGEAYHLMTFGFSRSKKVEMPGPSSPRARS